jgi:hypothetical protein
LCCVDNVSFCWFIPASLAIAMDRDCNGTWLKLESHMQREETSTRQDSRLEFQWLKNTIIMLDMLIKRKTTHQN